MGKPVLWIINEYAGAPKYGMEFRHFYLGKKLSELDYQVHIVSASYSHLFFNYPKVKCENIEGVNYHWLKVLKYPDAHSKKRVLKWFQFSTKLFQFLRKLPKPDFVYVSSPFLFPVIPAKFFADRYKAKFIFEIRDIWPLSLVELGGFSWNHPFIKLLRKIELFALEKADCVVSVLFNFDRYLEDIGMEREWAYIPNGIDITAVREEPLPNWFVKEVPKNKFIVAYTGTIGHANALDVLIESAALLKDKKEIVVLIVGKGKDKARLQEIVKRKELVNVKFLSPISKGQVISFLKNYVDVAYIGWWNKNIYNYGVSPNKLFDYMYAKKPIIHSISVENDLVSQANCGISVKAEDPRAVARALLKLYRMPIGERLKLGRNGYKFLIDNFTYEKIVSDLIEEVLR